MVRNKQKIYFSFHRALFLGLIFLVLNPLSILSQNPVIEEIIEELTLQSGDEVNDYTNFIEDLNNYLTEPLNLNEATTEDLEKLHFLTEFQVNNLLNYVSDKKGMTTIYELQLIEGFSMDVIRKIVPFVKVDKVGEKQKLKVSSALKYGKNVLIAQTGFLLQDQKAYRPELDSTGQPTTTTYPGNSLNYKLKYRFHYKDRIYAGFTAEKDAGEAFRFDKNNSGFDFYSAHFQLNNTGVVKKVNIGDFQAKFGQGLILWTGFGMGKSSEVMNIRKKAQGLRYYSSTDENNFLRGIGTTLKFGKLELITFFSYKKIDGNLLETDTLSNAEQLLSSLQNTGYHRTNSELENRKTVDETIFGSRLALSLKYAKIAANFVGYQYNYEFEKSDKPYELFDIESNKNINASIDYQLFYKKLSFFGEAAVSQNGAVALQNGLMAAIVPQISFSLLHRYYQKDYSAYYSSSFSENTTINNEQGLYYGIEFYPIRKFKLVAYADFYEFPWLKFGVDAPSEGNEYFIQVNYLADRNLEMYFRWRKESKSDNLTVENQALRTVAYKTLEQYRYHISYRVASTFNLSNRLEINRFQLGNSDEYGYMFYQDINFGLKQIPLSFYFRYAVFDASYNARSYSYENDVLYSFSVPSYSGKGSRFYFMMRYSIGNWLDLRVRYAQFFYPNQTSIGSGLSEIEGNLKSDFKIQLVFKF